MLYVSTRNINETYTAHRAVHEEFAPDGGFYVPFYLPLFSAEELNRMKSRPVCQTISDILNLFFSFRLNATDIEKVLGTPYFDCRNISQNLTVVELWHTPEGNYDYILKGLNKLLTGNSDFPVGWTRIAIEISLLFGQFSLISDKAKSFDMSVTMGDLSGLTAVLYAKAMGFPAKLVTCACDEGSILWDLVNKGEFSTSLTSKIPYYTELFLYKAGGIQCVQKFKDVCNLKKTYYIDDDLLQFLNEHIYPAVVSLDRASSIISGMYRSNQYMFDRNTALAYGSLQDYRAIVGANNQTVIFAKKHPEKTRE